MNPARFVAVVFIAASALVAHPASAETPKLTPGEELLRQKLADTYWSRFDNAHLGDPGGWFRFNADGTLSVGGREGVHPWKPIDDSTVLFQTKEPAKTWHRFLFNADMTEATEVSKSAPKEAGHGTIYRKLGAEEVLALTGDHKSPAAGSPEPDQNSKPAPLQTLSREAPNVSDWALAPLDQTVPTEIRQNLRLLREDLLDEAKMNPIAGPTAYAMGSRLCDALVSVLDERDQTRVRYGYRVAQANANVAVESRSLETNRSSIAIPRSHVNYWPDYAREKSQAAEIFRQQEAAADVKKELPKVEWSDRAAVLRKSLDILYEKYREEVRQTMKAPQTQGA